MDMNRKFTMKVKKGANLNINKDISIKKYKFT